MLGGLKCCATDLSDPSWAALCKCEAVVLGWAPDNLSVA